MVDENLTMWEIFVPTIHRVTGKPIKTRFHRVWDAKVRAISGGLSIMPVMKGQWVSKEGQVFFDRMIPVRIAATKEQIRQIMAITMDHYDELAIMCYLISNHVITLHKK